MQTLETILTLSAEQIAGAARRPRPVGIFACLVIRPRLRHKTERRSEDSSLRRAVPGPRLTVAVELMQQTYRPNQCAGCSSQARRAAEADGNPRSERIESRTVAR